MAGVCGNCIPCLAGTDACCTQGKISGYYTPGTFQQYALAPANYVTPIPDGLASDMAAPMLCGGVTVYSALNKSRAKAGEWVVIPGSGGGLGHLALQIGARGMGFRMIGIDMDDKEKLSMDCGAEKFFGLNNYSRDKEGSAKLAADVKVSPFLTRICCMSSLLLVLAPALDRISRAQVIVSESCRLACAFSFPLPSFLAKSRHYPGSDSSSATLSYTQPPVDTG
jgi:alcohol dehydrogenase, propanol-preferring